MGSGGGQGPRGAAQGLWEKKTGAGPSNWSQWEGGEDATRDGMGVSEDRGAVTGSAEGRGRWGRGGTVGRLALGEASGWHLSDGRLGR